MSADFWFASLLVFAGLAIIGVGAYLTLRQKVYYDPTNNSTTVEIPFLGKMITNIPALALCFVGVAPIFFGSNQMKNRPPDLLTFQGDVAIDPQSVGRIDEITVGITSNLWSDFPTIGRNASDVHVAISVPDSWPSYTAYAYADGSANVRAVRAGTSREKPTFSLRIAP